MKRCLCLLGLLLILVACGGSDDEPESKDRDQPPQPTATITLEYIPPLTPGFDTSGVPSPRGEIMKDGLTLLAANKFVKDDRLYIMFVVRNDSNQTYDTIEALINFIDEDDLVVGNDTIRSAFRNIPPGQVVALQQNFPIPVYYDGTSTAIRAGEGIPSDASPFLDIETEAELDAATSTVTGTATNVGTDSLRQIVAYFLLYGETEDDILAVLPATYSREDLNNSLWESGDSLEFRANVVAVAGDDLSAVRDVQLLVVGYIYDTSSP